MVRLGETRPLPGPSSIGSIKVKYNFILACLHPPRSPTREAVCRSSDKYQARRLPGVHPDIVIQHQGEDPKGKPTTPYLQH
ncbi:hypothetical protein TNCV_2546741 [Trichonephila clavipes]|nr:hypothetical protein TNCV_2546741 [Trichonephila clavipes]